MSMWLSKKKKADLVDLCDELGLSTDGLKKPEIEQNLKQHLYQQESTLSTHPSFSAYYETLARSPYKRGSSIPPPVFINPVDPVLPEGTKRERRQSSRFQSVPKSTRGYSASVEPEPSNALATIPRTNGIPEEDTSSEPDPQLRRRTGSTTPAPTRHTALNQIQSPSTQLLGSPTKRWDSLTDDAIPLPPSPAVVADLVEASTENLRARISTYTHEHLTAAITRRVRSTQQSLGNVVSVAVLVHLFELGTLVCKLMPASYPVTIPPIAHLHTEPVVVNFPDLFTLLEGDHFWNPIATWALVSIGVPVTVGFFFNLTRNPTAKTGYVCDPLTFALAKGILGWILFYKRTFSTEGLGVVEEAIGREVLVLMGSMVVGLVGLWEGLMTR